MKVITLWQPWATLWVLGFKIHETRGYATKHRGKLAVHAAKRRTDDVIMRDPAFRGVLAGVPMPLGAIIGMVDIDACRPVEDVRFAELGQAAERDYLFGDFSDGRFAWRARESWVLPKPIWMRGKQGFWTLPSEYEAELRATRKRTRYLANRFA